MRFFNTAGPVNAKDHCTLSPMKRLNPEEILSLIGQKKYFVPHAPRQTGKTSCLPELMRRISKDAEYRCLYANFERGRHHWWKTAVCTIIFLKVCECSDIGVHIPSHPRKICLTVYEKPAILPKKFTEGHEYLIRSDLLFLCKTL